MFQPYPRVIALHVALLVGMLPVLAGYPLVAAVLLAHKPREADLEDLLQDVALTVVAKVGDVRDVEGFRPWLRAVAVSVARTRGRRQKVRRQGFLRLVSWARADLGGADDHARADGGGSRGAAHDTDGASSHAIEHGRRLLELSADLPDGYREPLLLKAVQGMSYRQIGRVMGLPETTIETRIARARRMLRERAERDEQAGRDERGQHASADGSRQETENVVVARAANAPGSGVTS
jgi:RNA polymerase sigma-70 factor (ECF subfamily)